MTSSASMIDFQVLNDLFPGKSMSSTNPFSNFRSQIIVTSHKIFCSFLSQPCSVNRWLDCLFNIETIKIGPMTYVICTIRSKFLLYTILNIFKLALAFELKTYWSLHILNLKSCSYPWSTLAEGDEQPYQPDCLATQFMKVNIFCFSCEWTIFWVYLPLGQYSCSSPATKVLLVLPWPQYQGTRKLSWDEGSYPANCVTIWFLSFMHCSPLFVIS